MHRTRILAAAVFAIACAVMVTVDLASAQTRELIVGEKRLALVIGNAAYKVGPLKNPVNDARALREALAELGFEVVYRENVGMREMLTTLREFSSKASRYDTRLFFYAGHGIQSNGRNFLLPVDSEVRSEEELPTKAANVTDLIDRLAQLPSGNNIVILDACRNNPFKDMVVQGADGRQIRFRGTTPSGLSEISAPAGMLIAFAANRGQVALDGSGASNSLYTKHIVANIRTPGLTVEQFFRRVRAAVYSETKGAQRPFEEGSLFQEFCFLPGPGGRCGVSDSILQDPSKALIPSANSRR